MKKYQAETVIKGTGSMTASMMRAIVRGTYTAEEKPLPLAPRADCACPTCGSSALTVTLVPFESQVQVSCAACGTGTMLLQIAETRGTSCPMRVRRIAGWQDIDLEDLTDDEVRGVMARHTHDAVVEFLVVALRALKPNR